MSNKTKFKVGDAVYVRNGFTKDSTTFTKGACLKVMGITDNGEYACIPFSTPSFAQVEPTIVPQSALSNK